MTLLTYLYKEKHIDVLFVFLLLCPPLHLCYNLIWYLDSIGLLFVQSQKKISHDGVVHEKYMFWSNLNCKFGFFLTKKCTVGAVGTVAAPTNRFVWAAGTVAAPTNRFCRDN